MITFENIIKLLVGLLASTELFLIWFALANVWLEKNPKKFILGFIVSLIAFHVGSSVMKKIAKGRAPWYSRWLR